MIGKLALSLVLVMAGLAPAFAGFIEAQAADLPTTQAAKAVAEGDCGLGLDQWVDLVVSLGGTEAEAVFALNEMKTAGEVDIDQKAKTIKLKGVFEC